MAKNTKPSPTQIRVLRLMAAGNSLSVYCTQCDSTQYVRSETGFLDVHGNTVAAMCARGWIEEAGHSAFTTNWQLTRLGREVAREYAG